MFIITIYTILLCTKIFDKGKDNTLIKGSVFLLESHNGSVSVVRLCAFRLCMIDSIEDTF